MRRPTQLLAIAAATTAASLRPYLPRPLQVAIIGRLDSIALVPAGREDGNGAPRGLLLGGRRGSACRPQRCVVVLAGKASGKGSKEVYVCSDCGEDHGQWQGKCRACQAWNTLVAFRPSAGAGKAGGGGGGGAAVQAVAALEPLRQQSTAPARTPRVWVTDSSRPQRLSEVIANRGAERWRLELPGDNGAEMGCVLGGGVVPGSLTLVTGDPGVGKSTLMLQLAALLGEAEAAEGLPCAEVVYISAEESMEQVAERARRLGLGAADVMLLNATQLEGILETVVRLKPKALVVDSIQTIYLDGGTGTVGSVSQVRECASAILRVAKQENFPVFLIGHVTKSGDVAGPRTLEHIVDVVLYIEGERQQSYRMVRSTKNRYGPTDEVGVFSMSDAGFAAVLNPSAEFMSERVAARGVGTCIAAMLEGSRPMLLEVQALCTPVAGDQPGSLVAIGCDFKRLQLLVAILNKHTRLNTFRKSVFVNVVGGLKMLEPSTDLPIAMAVASSIFNAPVPGDVVLIGELGLAGELRKVRQLEKRLAEAVKLGFKRAIIPAQGSAALKPGRYPGMECVPCNHVREVVQALFPGAKPDRGEDSDE